MSWIERRPLLTVAIAACIVHVSVIGLLMMRWGGIDALALRSLDSLEYHRLAKVLVAFGEFGAAGPEFWRTPGYPLILAGLMRLGLETPALLVLAQQAMGVLNAVLFACVVLQVTSPKRALIASALFIIEPYHLYYSAWLLSATLFTTCLLLTWLLWLKVSRAGSVSWTIVLGLLCGFTILVRPLAIMVPLALVIAWWIARSPRPIVCPLVLIACTGLLPAKWMERNKTITGHFSLSSQGGVVLAYFKAAEVALWNEGRTADRYIETNLDERVRKAPHVIWDRIDARLHERNPDLTPIERWPMLAQGNQSFHLNDELWFIGREMLLDRPLSTVACCLTRVGVLLTTPLHLAVREYNTALPAPDDKPTGSEGEVTSVGCIYRGSLGAAYGVWVLWVLYRCGRRRLSRQDLAFAGIVLLVLLMASAPQTDPRLRVPMIPMLAYLAVVRREPQAASQENGEQA